MKTGFTFLILALVLAGCAESNELGLSNLDSTISALGGDTSYNNASYTQIGNPTYDTFFKNVARLNSLVQTGKKLTASSKENLKKTAFAAYAKEELKSTINKMVGYKPTKEWTLNDLVSVTNLAAQKGLLSGSDLANYAVTAVNLGAVATSLAKGGLTAPDLLAQAVGLNAGLSSLGSEKTAATSAMQSSVSTLNGLKNDAPVVARDLNQLASTFRLLSGN